MQQLQPNTLLQGGRYRIVRFISSGGFGCTYEAEHVMLHKKVAIKEFFVKEFCNRDETTSLVTVAVADKVALFHKLKAKFIEEAQSLCTLEHPNIVHVYDVFEENGTAYYVMDYIDGLSLKDMVKKYGPMDEQKAVGYILQVASALELVHSRNRLHLDIKPANIMVDEQDKALLIDFGASKQYDEVSGENNSTMIGITPGYAPLEQMGNNISKFAPSTDIYALGATLYNLLTGVSPLSASNRASGENLELIPSTISENVQKAVYNAMQLVKTKRPQSINEFVGMLAAATDKKNTVIEENTEETILHDNDKTIVNANIHESVEPEPQQYDKEKVAYNAADLIINEGYDEDMVKTYLTSKEKVQENDIPGILESVEGMVRQSNKEAGKKDIIQALLWIVGGVVLTIFTAGMFVFYGAPLWGLYQVTRGCKSYYAGQMYGKASNKIKWYALATIALLVAAIGYFQNSTNSNMDDFIASSKQLHGYGVEKNSAEAIEKLKDLADRGYGPAALILANSYLYGLNDVEADTVQSDKYFDIVHKNLSTQAADGDKCAQAYLGYMYMYGIHVSKDLNLAEKFLKLAAEQDYEVGQTYLGLHYWGSNRESDAFSWINKAAEKNYPPAVTYQARMYAYGLGTSQDSLKYASLLTKAAEMNEISAKTELGYMYMVGNSYIKRDSDKGLQMLKDSDVEGNVDAALYLAWCYLDGTGVNPDVEKAKDYALRIAAKYQTAAAQLILGYCYDAQNDYVEAMKWYALAANQNNPKAQYQMSVHYRDGLGVEASQEYADKWYQKAIANGYRE